MSRTCPCQTDGGRQFTKNSFGQLPWLRQHLDEDDGRSCYRLDDGKVRQSFLMFFLCPGLHTAEEKDHDDYNDDNRYVPGGSILVKSHHMVRKNNL